ncbi:hypothetical protein ABFA07_001962 [Porites harrisoni]
MRETLYQIKSPTSRGTPYKDWATTVKEAKARQIPIGLPQNLKNYFENALRKPPISNIFGSEANEAQEQRKSHDKRMTRRNVLCHVSRNRPHPTIYFPFQTGDRLQTYMVWIPEDRHTTTSMSLPPVHQRRPEQSPPPRNCQTRMSKSFGYGQFTSLNQTTYQDEIARTPFLHRNIKMRDHFPSGNLNSNTSSLHRVRVR